MYVHSLSVGQLKDLRKNLKKTNRKFLFFRYLDDPHTADGVSLSTINLELKRRKIQKLKLGERAKY